MKKRANQPTTPPEGAAEPHYGVVVPRSRVGRLDTVACWRKEVGRIYRAMRRGDLDPQDATKLAFVAQIGARLTEAEEQLREAARIAAALEQQRSPIARLEAATADAVAVTGDLVPVDTTEAQP